MLPPNLYARVQPLLCAIAHETAGAARTRSSLLYLEGGKFQQTSGRTCRENAASYSAVIARLDRATQYSETPMIEPMGRGVLVPRLRGDDSGACRAISASFRGSRSESPESN